MEPKNIQTQVVETEPNTSEKASDGDVNIYPKLRHLILILCVLLTITIVVFLIYQNGKSIYANGI